MADLNRSITDFSDLLPYPGATDMDERMTRLAEKLRDTPLTEDSRALFQAAQVALDKIPASAATPELVLCYNFIVRSDYLSGNALAGIETARRAVAIAEDLGNSSVLCKALKMLGALYLETGSYTETVTTLSKALSAAQEAKDGVQEAEIILNLGLAHQHAGFFGAAVPCFKRGAELSRLQIPNDPERAIISSATALGNLAHAHLHLRDFPSGVRAAQEAVSLLDPPRNSYGIGVRSMVECYYARLLLELNDPQQARERIALAKEFASRAPRMAQLTAEMTLGLVEVHDPSTRDIGLSRLQRAVDTSRAGAQSALRDALSMIVRGYEVVGQPNAALVYLHELRQLSSDRRVKSVLFHHQLQIGKVARRLDRRASEALDEQQRQLSSQRLSMDVLHECMLVLEKNTVAAELHDDDTGEHCYRVGALAKELAMRWGMDTEMCTLVDLSARLHDIGKLRIPDAILLKPGKFTPEERAIMSQHCQHGVDLIGVGGLAQLFVAQEIALNHHERWDGSGYPNRRKGNMIPLAARIATLADVFDALTHRRCYKKPWTVDEALAEISAQRGKHFDPDLTDIFLALIADLRARHSDLDAYLGAEARKNDFITDRARIARELKQHEGTYGPLTGS